MNFVAIEGLGGTKSNMDDEETEDSQKEGVAFLYIIFACVCIVTTLFIYTTVPETKGKTPEDFMSSEYPAATNDNALVVNTANPMSRESEMPISA